MKNQIYQKYHHNGEFDIISFWVENQNIYRLDKFHNLEDLQMIDDWFGVTM